MAEGEKKIPLAGLSLSDLGEIMERHGIDRHYAVKLLYWVYRRRIGSFDLIDDIPLRVLKAVSQLSEPGLFAPSSAVRSDDGSVKYLFTNSDGLLYESVYIPDGRRHTLCISVQSGCRMACRFCATGSYGWHGSLAAGEMINQVLSVPHEITNIVFMGMGEPCDNIDEVIKACSILVAQWGLAKGRSNITVSTVGIMPAMQRLLDETECNITLSLHSPFAEERELIVPAERLTPAAEIIERIRNFSNLRKRRFTVAYVMINGVNDTDRHLSALQSLLAGTGIRVNLIPYHPIDDSSAVSSTDERMMFFKHQLVTSGVGASVRRSRGTDISAACGMLAAAERKR